MASASRPDPSAAPRIRRAAGCGVAAAVALLLLLGTMVAGVVWLRANEYIAPTPFEPRCRFEASGETTVLDLGQTHNAAVIVGRAVARELPARAGSIAMATAYQESGVRNLDYGDRDSLGLFQQRPSQGWGTAEQIQDPYYSTDAFYDALVEVEDWEGGDINTVAQAVQRSGYPEAYRKHEPNARIVSSVLTGYSPGGVTCGFSTPAAPDPGALAESLRLSLGATARAGEGVTSLTATGSTDEQAWAIAHHAVALADRTGVAEVRVAGRSWTWRPRALPDWTPGQQVADPRTVTVTFRESGS